MSESLSSREIVVYALYLLGGAAQRCHTEDVALKCFELAPDSFSWTKYPKYPDKDVVRVALTDAKKEKYGNLVEGRAGLRSGHHKKSGRGRATDGWELTTAGIEWVDANKDRLESIGASDREAKEHRQKSLQALKRLKSHAAFTRFIDSPERFTISIGELADLFRCRVDADVPIWNERVSRYRKHAQATKQEQMIEFLEACSLAIKDSI
jgi:hypothetical protein